MRNKYILYFIILIFLSFNIFLLNKINQEKNNISDFNTKIKNFEERIINTNYIIQLLKNNVLTTIKNFDLIIDSKTMVYDINKKGIILKELLKNDLTLIIKINDSDCSDCTDNLLNSLKGIEKLQKIK